MEGGGGEGVRGGRSKSKGKRGRGRGGRELRRWLRNWRERNEPVLLLMSSVAVGRIRQYKTRQSIFKPPDKQGKL